MIKTVSIGQNEIEYAVFGSGSRPFVILPGLALKSVLPAETAICAAYRAITEAYEVYLFEAPPVLPEDWSIEDYAELVAAAVQAIGIANAAVFGASTGGMAAQLLAIRHPELVSRLLLGSTMCENTETSRESIGRWRALSAEGRAEELAADMTDRVYSARTLEKHRDAILAMNSGVGKTELRRCAVLTNAILHFSSREALSGITCPVLVIGCENDRVLGPESSRELAKRLGCELYMYPACYGHAVYDEAPDYRERLESFCGL